MLWENLIKMFTQSEPREVLKWWKLLKPYMYFFLKSGHWLFFFFFFFDSPMKFEKVFNVEFQFYIILASTHIWIFLNFGMLWENLIKGSHKVGWISQSHPFSYHKRSHHLQPLSQTHPHDMPLYWKTTLQLFFPPLPTPTRSHITNCKVLADDPTAIFTWWIWPCYPAFNREYKTTAKKLCFLLKFLLNHDLQY